MSFPLITSPLSEEREIRSRLVRFYEKHHPQQLNHIDIILFVEGPDTPSFFTLLDPMVVVRGRLKKSLEDSKEYEAKIMNLENNTIQKSQQRLRRDHLTMEDEESIILRLRFQQIFMCFIPNEVFHMEEILPQYREAYKEKVRSSGDSYGSITDKEWQEAILNDFLHEFD
ncbi:hypothetical protein LSM04_006041 [Trypanosoma melophagium]|uniref:uncharacterized protein n=1 Tax=Trypanosoma melophagium TaxID=715481 RepID=UPI00351AADEA|nr:hypothetical protein LSM04_006041 [Trypanosoma melophagium]